DFSWYLEYVPGALARLGVGRSGPNVDLHRASFDVDERAIPAGVRLMVETAVRSLAAQLPVGRPAPRPAAAALTAAVPYPAAAALPGVAVRSGPMVRSGPAGREVRQGR